MEPTDDPFAVTLAPSPGAATRWTVAGAVATALAGFTLGHAIEPLVPSALLLLTVAATAVYALQVFAPQAWTLHADRDHVDGHVAGVRVTHDLADIRAIEVVRVLGDHVLVLHGHTATHRLLLPVGCDVAALRRLAAAIDADAASGHRTPPSVPQPPSAP